MQQAKDIALGLREDSLRCKGGCYENEKTRLDRP
jgi:hypothetical protein